MKTTNLTRERWFIKGALFLQIFFWLAFFSGPAQAVQIKKVQRGVANFDNYDVSISVPISAVDRSKSIILLMPMGGVNAADQNFFFTAQFESDTVFQVNRAGASGASGFPNGTGGWSSGAVTWQVVEFVDGVNVQRGISSMGQNVIDKKIVLSGTTDLTKAVPIIQTQCALTTNNFTQELFVLPSFVTEGSDKKLRLERLNAEQAKTVQIVWQVIEFLKDATVQTGTKIMPVPGVLASPQTVDSDAITGVNNPLLFTYYSFLSNVPTNTNAEAGREPKFLTTGEFTGAAPYTKVTFNRFKATTTVGSHVAVRFYVVDLTDDSSFYQSNSYAYPTNVTNKTISSSADGTPIRVTATGHGFATDERITITGHSVTDPVDGIIYSPIDGIWTVNVIDANNFTLRNSTAHGIGANGSNTGYAQKAHNTTLQATGTIAIDPSRTVTLATVRANSDVNSSRTHLLDSFWVAPKLYDSTTIDLFRHYDSYRAEQTNVMFEALQFNPLTLTTPSDSGLIYSVGDNVEINWEYADSLLTGGGGPGGHHLLTIQVSVNDGAYQTVYDDVDVDSDASPNNADNRGRKFWTILDKVGTTNLINAKVKIKIIDKTNTDTSHNFYTSKNYFQIKPRLVIEASHHPQSGETFTIGTHDPKKRIEWKKYGDLSDANAGSPYYLNILMYDNGGYNYEIIKGRTQAQMNCTGNDCYYEWDPVPEKTGTDRKVKIYLSTDLAGATADPWTTAAASLGDFYIKGGVTLDEAGSTARPWYAQKPATIKWTKSGDFSADGFIVSLSKLSGAEGTFNTIATPTQAAACSGDNCSYTWDPIPVSAVGTMNRIRVETNQGEQIKATSTWSSDISILASLEVLDPKLGTEILRVDGSYTIKWKKNGAISFVKIEYSTKDAPDPAVPGDWTLIPGANSVDASIGETTGKVWSPIQVPISNKLWIKVTDTTNPNIYAVSAAACKVKGNIVVRPLTSNKLKVGTTETLQWECHGDLKTAYGNAKIYLSKSGGEPFDTMITDSVDPGTPGGIGSHPWPIPNNSLYLANTCKVKVYMPGEESLVDGVADASEQFSIKADIQAVTLDKASYNIGNAAVITWTPRPADLAGTVRLKYSKTGLDGSWTNLNPATKAASSGTYDWTIPDEDLIGTTVRIRVELVGDETEVVNDSSQFTIKGSITLKDQAKTGDVTWKIGDKATISWDKTGTALGDVRIKYFLTSGSSYAIATVPSSDGSYDWYPGYNANGTGTTPGDPAHDPQLVIGDSDKDTQVRIRIESVNDASGIFSETDTGKYIILQKQYLNVAVPKAVLYVGDKNADDTNISWTTKGRVPPPPSIAVKLAYDKGDNNFAYDINDGDSTPDGGGFLWEVPNAIGDQIKVRVMSSSSEDILGDSGIFTIKGKILSSFPTVNDTLIVGKDVLGGIQYEKRGDIGNLKIEYIHNGYSTEITPVGGTDQATAFPWTVIATDSNGGNVIDVSGSKNSKFKFTSLGDLPITKESQSFQVRGDIYDVEPFNGLPLPMGSTQTIKWKCRGDVGNVRIRLDLFNGNGPDEAPNTGDEYQEVVYAPDDVTTGESVPYAQGTVGWSWKIPNLPSSQGRIRVESIANPYNWQNPTNPMATWAKSEGTALYLRGAINSVILADTPWKNGDLNRTIDWTVTGSVGNVNITLLYDHNDDGPPWNHIHSFPIVSNNAVKPYPWPEIPDSVTSEHAVIRVSSYVDSMVTNTSAEFKIKAVLSPSVPASPNISSEWEVGTKPTISWAQPKGDVPFVKIQISTDGTTWSDTNPPTIAAKGGLIVDSTSAATLKYEDWLIPDFMAKNCIIRVSKVGDPEVKFDSAPFNVKGVIAVNNPNGIDLPVGNNTPKKVISWTYKGSLGTVDLWYATDGDQANPAWQQITNGQGISIGSNGTGSFEWDPIPATPSSKVKVKVESTSNLGWKTVSGTSVINAIIGSIAYTEPNGQTMEVGSKRVIRWLQQGGISKFAIYYKYGAQTWAEITPAGGIAGTDEGGGVKSWEWPSVADTINTGVHFKVVDYDNQSKVYAESTIANMIKGTLTLLSPNGSSYYIGDNVPIQWNKKGSIGTIKIVYSAKGDFSDELVISPTQGCGADGDVTLSPAWSAPYKVSETYKVRITNNDAPAGTELSVTSSPAFGVRPKIINISSPEDTSIWKVGETANKIQWEAISATKTDGSKPKIKIEYNINNGVGGYTPIGGAESLDCNDGTTGNEFTWPSIPNERTNDTVRVKISFLDYPSDVNLVSPGFSILPEITLDPSINASSRVKALANVADFVKFTYTGTKIQTVNVRYDLDGGTAFTGVIQDGLTVSGGSAVVPWNPTPDVKSGVKIRVVDTANSSVKADSVGFNIIGGLTLKAPLNGTTTWTAKSTTNEISWDFSGSIDSVSIYYDPNSGKGLDGIAGNADDYNNHTPIGTKDLSGSSGTGIKWLWNPMPDTVTNNARIKITDGEYDSDCYSEGTDFKVGAKFDITDPEQGNTAHAGDDYWITWNNYEILGVIKVKISYSNNIDDAIPVWTPITTEALNNGSFKWSPVPGTLADLNNTNRLKIEQYDPANSDVTTINFGTGKFSLLGKITVDVPDGNTSWLVGTPQTIKFKKQGALQSVNVYYSFDGQEVNYTKINDNALGISGAPDGDGYYTFDWPLANSTALTAGKSGKIKVKVATPTTQAAVEGASAGFQVKGGLTYVGPKSESLEVGAKKNIIWTPQGNIDKVAVYYKYDGGGWNDITVDKVNGDSGVEVGDGNMSWEWSSVPDTISSNVLFKVADFKNKTTVYAESTAGEKNIIKGTLTLLSPNGSSYYIGDNVPIRWNKKGSIGTLRIVYSAKGDFTDEQVISGTQGCGADGDVTLIPVWTAPFKVSENFKVKITNNAAPAGTELSVQSSPAFGVRPKITLISSPEDTSVWKVNETTNKIQWEAVSATKTDGSKPKVKIEYNIYDGVGSYNQISGAESLECNNGTTGNEFTWPSIPDERTSDTVRVKISFVDYPTDVNLVSPGFSILPEIILDPSINASTRVKALTTAANFVKWTKTGNKITRVNVLCDLDGSNQFLTKITPSDVAVGDGIAGVDWSVPDVRTGVKIRVVDLANSNVKADSAAFNIIGGLTLKAPLTGANWKALSTANQVSWDFSGSISSVSIYYDSNGGKGADNIAGNADDYNNHTPIGTKTLSGSSGTGVTWSWNPMPAAVTNNGRIKITDGAYNSDSYSEGADFSVIPDFSVNTVTSPLISADPWLIEWDTVGTGADKVKLEFYRGTGVVWDVIDALASNLGAHGQYSWTVPETTSSISCKVRVTASEPVQPASEKESNSFWIHGKIDVITPDGSSKWKAGEEKNIVFNVTGKIDKVNILYSKDGGIDNYQAKTIATNFDVHSGENTCPWTPNLADDIFSSDKAKIKIVDTAYNTVYGLSSNFSLGNIRVLQPDASQSWTIKKSGVYNIQWEAKGVDNVNIYFSSLDGASGTYSSVGSAAGSAGTLPWPQTPDAVTNAGRIKIINALEAVDTAVIAGVSPAFKLIEEFSAIHPRGGAGGTDPLTANDATNITWSKLGESLAKVKLYLSTDNGAHYDYFLKETDNTSTAGWNVPADVRSTLCKIKVMSSINENNFAVSESVFTIKNRLAVTYPKIGTLPWTVGSKNNIQWNYEGPNQIPGDPVTPVKLKIEYASDGSTFNPIPGASDVSIGSNGAGSWEWTIADDTALTTTGKIKITDTGISSATATSTGDLTIRGGVTPDEITNTPLKIDDPMTITWTLHGAVTQVNIYYSISGPLGSFTKINTAGPWDATQPYTTFNVPEAYTDQFRIKVEDANNPSVSNITQTDVKIVGKIELKVPNTLEPDWIIGGSKKNIKFFPIGQFAVRIEGSTDDFVAEQNKWEFAVIPADQITSRADNTFQYDVPDKISNSVKIRVSDADPNKAALVTDKSEQTFRILGALVVTKPSATSPALEVDKPFTLEWQRKGTIPAVDIWYSTSSATGPWTNIAMNYTNTGEYTTRSWTPVDDNDVTTHAYIKVCDHAHPTEVLDASDPFTIKGWFEFAEGDSPALNEKWEVGKQHTITWTKHGNIPTVKIEYTPDGLNYYSAVSSASNTGSCPWTPVPTTTFLSAVAQLRIVDTEDATNISLPSPTFKLAGVITLISPSPTVGGQKYIVDSSQTVTWKVTGKIDNVRIDYSTTGAAPFNELIKDSTPGGNGDEISYTWPITNTPSPTVVVRVSDVKDPSAAALSAVNKIQCQFKITSPATGYVWPVDSQQNLIWATEHGTCPSVKIELYNGTAWEEEPIYPSTINPPEGGALSWKVLNRINTACKIRVSDTRDPDAQAESGAFRIRAGLVLKFPNGSENLNVGAKPNILWEKHGTISTVKLEYSTDGVTYPASPALPDNPIATNVDVSGCTDNCSFEWEIPDALSSKVRVKVTNENALDPCSDDSDALNTIRGVLNITSFTANEVVKIGVMKPVSWSKVGSIDYVKLEYSVNNAAYQVIPGAGSLASTGATGTYEWTPANDFSVSDNVKVRVSSADETNQPALAGVSPQFEVQPTLTFIQCPSVNEVVTVDSVNTLKWIKTGSINTVKMQLKLGAGGFTTITGAGSLDVTGASPYSYPWTVPPSTNDSVLLRVVSNADADVFSESPLFKIAPGVNLTSPNGGSFYEVDSPCLISWTTSGTINNVSFYYDINGGKGADGIAGNSDDYPNFIITKPANESPYSWPTPDKIGDKLRVKIVNADAGNFSPSDASEANFEIRGRIDIDSPVGGEIWKITEIHDIQWHKHGTMSAVKVEYSTGGAYQYCRDAANQQATSETGNSFAWKIPDAKSINAARVKVTNLANPDNVLTITPTFTIRGGFIWDYPVTAGQVFKVGSTETLSWQTKGTSITSINLEYSVNGTTFKPMLKLDGSEATGITNTGSFNWRVPNDISKTVTLRVRDATDPDAVEDSAVIKIAGVIHIDAPTTLVRWGVGTDQDIKWHTDGDIANLKIEYSITGAAPWIVPVIADAAVGSTGLKKWRVPNNCTPTAAIRISDVIAESGTDPVISPIFKIVGSFAFNSPVITTNWPVTSGEIANTKQSISWATQGVISQVNLFYSKTGAAPWTLITTPGEGGPITDNGNGGSFQWTVPDSISTTCKIRIEDKDDDQTFTESAAFTIRGDLRLDSPVTNEKIAAGTTKTIMWSRNGSIAKINLLYHDGVTWQNILDPNNGNSPEISNSGSFNWAIPADMRLTDMAKLIIRSVGDPVVETPQVVFKVMGGFEVTYPKGGESLLVNSTPTITWTSTSTRVDTVRIDYSIDGGETFPESQVISASTANDGSFAWSTGIPPEAVSKEARIRVSDTTDRNDAFGISKNDFFIRAIFTLTEPNGYVESDPKYPLNWVIGRTNRIKWICIGALNQVKLEFSRYNDFNVDKQPVGAGIVSNNNIDPVSGNRYYDWTIPDGNASNNVLVRISDPNDPEANDVSDYKFRVIPGFTVTSPTNGTESWAVGSSHEITWTSTSSSVYVPQVRITYSQDGGSTFPGSVTVTDNDGSYHWNPIPNSITAEAKIKVADSTDSSAFDVSDNNFSIRSDLNLTYPNGGSGQTFTVGDPCTIIWTCQGTVDKVNLEYLKAGVPGVIASNVDNDNVAKGGSFAWPGGVSDAISSQVRVRVTDADAGHPASSDTSANDFRIKGALTITAPVSSSICEVDKDFLIQWNTVGSIENVELRYSLDGSSFPDGLIIVANASNTGVDKGKRLWRVPNPATPTAKIRITDASAGNSDVSDDSDEFHTRVYFEILSPNAGTEVWKVGEVKNITWKWGGEKATVKLSYSTTGANGTYNPISPAAIVANGAGGSGTHSYAWTVEPEAVSKQVRFKIEDPGDPDVSDISDNDFTVQGAFAVTSPNAGTERWITRETKPITWTSVGNIPRVKLEYYLNNDYAGTKKTIAANVVNNTGANTYNWYIPDIKDADGNPIHPTTVRIRVSDVNDPDAYDDSNNPFTIDYYSVTWEVKDLISGQHLTQLSVAGASDKLDPDTGLADEWKTSTMPNLPTVPLGSPVTMKLPAGFWSILWTKSGYGDKQSIFNLNRDMTLAAGDDWKSDGNGLLFMETTAIHIWEAKSNYSYNPAVPLKSIPDTLTVSSWLQRDGFVVSGGIKADVYVYEDGTQIRHLQAPGADAVGTNPDEAGFFHTTWSTTGLKSGKVYTTITDITNASGAHFKTPGSFTITQEKLLQETQDTVNRVLDKPITEVEAKISQMITGTGTTAEQLIAQGGMKGILETKLDDQTSLIVGPNKTKAQIMDAGGMVGMLETSLISFESKSTVAIDKLQSGADQAVKAGQDLEATAKKFSWGGNAAPDPALQGDTITLQVQGPPSLLPMLSIYTWDNKTVVSNVIMTETRPGFYIYQFLADARFTAGKAYTYMVIEDKVTGGLISGSGMVESMGISTVAGLAAAAPEAERAAKKALEAIQAVESVLVSNENINISLTLKNLKESVDALPETLNKEGPNTTMMNAINGISERLSKIMGQEGMDFSELLDEKLGSDSSIKQLRNKTDTISAIVDLLLQIMESKLGGVDSPIISTSLQSGSVKFRIMVINPSKTKVQRVPVKKYLPEEVRPKDVMDLGGLELEYDSEKGIYYVYKNDLEMQPNQINVFEVEVEDIWIIPESVLSELKKRTGEILALFQKSPLYDKAKEVTDTIYPVLEEIPKVQLDDTVSREQHIGFYRQNQENIKTIREKLTELEKMLSPENGRPTPNILERSRFKINLPAKSTTWLIILVVIIFLGVFAGIFFFVWQGQIKSSQESIKDAAKSSFPGQKPEEKGNAPPK